MRRTLENTRARIVALFPKGPLDAVRQLGLFVIADLFYESVRGIADNRQTEAFANAHSIVSFEKSLGSFFEPDLQSVVVGHRWIVDAANFSYMNSHFVLTAGFLTWLYLRRNETFYFVRNMFMVAMGLALVGYALLPTAPPRLLTNEGFVDTITRYAQVNHDSALVALFVNPYAAVPSMHIAFSLLISVPAMMIARRRIAKVAWALYTPSVFFVIVVTANHFWIDAAAGAVVAGLSALVAYHVLSRVRPAAWTWRVRAGEATA